MDLRLPCGGAAAASRASARTVRRREMRARRLRWLVEQLSQPTTPPRPPPGLEALSPVKTPRSGSRGGCARDRSSRYADLSLQEEDLLRDGRHVLAEYIMKPKAGCDYLATAAFFAAESSTCTNASASTEDCNARSLDALVYDIDPREEIMKIAFPTARFDRSTAEGRAAMRSALALGTCSGKILGEVENGKICGIYFPSTCAP